MITVLLPFDRFTAFSPEPDRFRRQYQRQNSTRLHGRRQFHRSIILRHVTDWAARLSDLFHTSPSDSANMIAVSMWRHLAMRLCSTAHVCNAFSRRNQHESSCSYKWYTSRYNSFKSISELVKCQAWFSNVMQECIPQRWNAVFETSISLLSWRVVPQVRLDQQIATDSVLGRMNASHTCNMLCWRLLETSTRCWKWILWTTGSYCRSFLIVDSIEFSCKTLLL